MKIIRLFAVSALASVLGLGVVQAQTGERQPTEIPPDSYKGKQYVDSDGCVFIRAGIDGNVSWVPRVTRDRKIVCGFAPSLPSQVASAEVVPEETEVAAAAPETSPSPVVKPAVRTAKAKAKPRRKAPVVRRQTAPKPVAVASVDVFPKPPVRLRTAASGRVEITPQTRIAPVHVVANRVNTRNVTIPRGYRRVWDDDRLNPHRAEQNLDGRNDMLLVWTRTVPRRLIDQRSGRDMTASVPLVYPYVDIANQQQRLGEVTLVEKDGQRMKRIIRNQRPVAVVRPPVLSSRSAPKAPLAKPQARVTPKVADTGVRYVQIGLFTTPAKAQAAAQRIARMGMPARIGKKRQGGKLYSMVQAGPFAGQAAAQVAQEKVVGAGYDGRVLRD
ncbi:SPOR domain-containing protein [Sulfitobacter mediterraneus]|uniref:SPOR domain-containing protein n=1 Tax=Sulfitobacter mediterraneus TaxID=83219 RepID=UPI001939E0D6|nr:SPOR domain-containing protein [Sulfitobacter mediterraneus]MBM1556090.1 SPOR domain-containing protein [Sulfitobacter mediterraneus]MBM1567872.1 SPOR domain-containing protein [Sulfitobacter mediterraneus]MBM1571444.1 SPOR domain-containing protein [Sulfitobacter mediterraneus]MBM1575232.1 SPOR domain-containing protein [Sulfitobacter mediterraneus]MBM1579277.1 SPOR domain-containing protein [Sulfitobacter mediterraneus]